MNKIVSLLGLYIIQCIITVNVFSVSTVSRSELKPSDQIKQC